MSSSDATFGRRRLPPEVWRRASERTGRLVVRSPGSRLEVLDPYLRPVDGSGVVDLFDKVLEPGAYRVTARLAGARESRLVIVRRGPSTELDLRVEFDAAAPLPWTATENESHGMLAGELTARSETASEPTSSLVVVLRGLRNRPMAPLDSSFTVLDDRGHTVSVPKPQPDPFAPTIRALGWWLPLPAGGYRLRWSDELARPVEHAVWLSPGWQTLLFVPQGPRGPVLAGSSVHLVPHGTRWDRYSLDAMVVERALGELREAPTAIGPQRWTELDHENPMIALLTAHLVLRTRRAGFADQAEASTRLTAAVQALRTSLGRHPDVLALAAELAITWGQDGVPRVQWPPMITASLDLLLAAGLRGVDVIPSGGVTEAVSGQRYASEPWLLWDPTGLALPGAEPAGPGFDVAVGRFADSLELPPGSPPWRTVLRVLELVSGVADQLQIHALDAADRLGVAEIARRTGMTTSLVAACLSTLRP